MNGKARPCPKHGEQEASERDSTVSVKYQKEGIILADSLWIKIQRLTGLGLRKCYNIWRRARLRCQTPPSIISSDCTGGILCHDLGLEFRSPTINLIVPAENFILLCRHLADFLAAEVKEAECQEEYPVGLLETEHGTVTLRFLHYESFPAAKQAWERRKARVDENNLRLVLHVSPADLTETLLKDYEALPYKHKVLISYGIDRKKYPHGYNLPIYKTGFALSIGRYPTPHSIRRHMDAFNWIAFLNGKQRGAQP